MVVFVRLPSVLWHYWLRGRKGIRPAKRMGGWWRWALVSPDGVVSSQMGGLSSSVIFPLLHKVQKFSSGTGSPGWSRKRAVKWLCVFSVCTLLIAVMCMLCCVDVNITSVKHVHWSSTKSRHAVSSVASKPAAFLIQPKVHTYYHSLLWLCQFRPS